MYSFRVYFTVICINITGLSFFLYSISIIKVFSDLELDFDIWTLDNLGREASKTQASCGAEMNYVRANSGAS